MSERDLLTGGLWLDDRDDRAEQEFAERHGNVGQITAGTVLEYDGWQWALVSELATDRDEPMVGFILLDELGDDVVERIEKANGCRQHFAAVAEFCGGEHEYWAPTDYVTTADIWNVLGPVHPDHRDKGGEQ